jgi:glycosyltransferase involved in cell wall biosynthesis
LVSFQLLKLRPSLPIDIIPCPLRSEIHSISRQHLSDSAERNLVVCCSRLSPEKNVELFVDLMCHPKMVSAMRRLRLQPCLVGATVDQQYAHSLTARLYASHPDAECHDFMPAVQLSQLFLRSCLYFHASLNESFGMTILEAAAFASAPAMNCRRIGAGDLLNASNSIKLDFDLPLEDTVDSIGTFVSDNVVILTI